MAVIVKVQAQWQGFQGAPGYTNWYGLSDGDAAAAAQGLGNRMRAFFEAIKAYLVTGSTVKVQRLYQVLESTTGRITAEASLGTDPAANGGTGSGAYSGASGAVVNWETGAFNAKGHRLRSRTYLVPLAAAYDANGGIAATPLGIIQTAAGVVLGGPGALICYSKPSVKGATDGQVNIVSAAIVHNKAAVLRSRRD